MNRRGFLGKVAWVTSGGVLASLAALEISNAMAETSGPTGVDSGGGGRDLPTTGGASGAVLAAGAILAAGGAAVAISRQRSSDAPDATA